MKIKNIENLPYDVFVNDLENLFNIYKDNLNYFIYNLNSTLYLNVNKDDLDEYICNHDMHWPLISYKLYKTTRLSWFLMKINNVKAKDSFKIINAGQSVFYLDKDSVLEIINNINR